MIFVFEKIAFFLISRFFFGKHGFLENSEEILKKKKKLKSKKKK